MAAVSIPRPAVEVAATTVDHLYFSWFAILSALILIFHSRLPGWQDYLALHAIVVIAILTLIALAPEHRWAGFLHDWYPLAVFILCFEEVARLSFLLASHWEDHYLLAFEARLFPTPPTVWLAAHGNFFITELMELGYFSYFVLLMIVGGALYSRPGRREFRQVMTASVVSYLICYVSFLLFPTEGPHHTLAALHTAPISGGPFHGLVLFLQRHSGVHGCAFPSSHVAAGLVALIFAWKYAPRLGAALTPLVVLLCAGAVYDRYHYVSDILAGLLVGALAASLVLHLQPLRANASATSDQGLFLHQIRSLTASPSPPRFISPANFPSQEKSTGTLLSAGRFPAPGRNSLKARI